MGGIWHKALIGASDERIDLFSTIWPMITASGGTNIAHSGAVGNGKAMAKSVLASAPGVAYDDQRK